MEAEGAKGWDASAEAWIARVDSGDPSREVLLDPVVLELCGDVDGLSVLDVGCGEGRFSRKLSERGAVVIGFDPCFPLARLALDRQPVGRYLRASAEAIPLATGQFDLVVCYLVLIDVPGFRAAIREMARVLRPSGKLVVANIVSFRTACDTGWVRDESGRRLHVAVDGYYAERATHAEWCGISVTNYHRPAEAYFGAFLDAGLRLTAYREPRPSADVLAAHAEFEPEARVPLFNVMAWIAS